MTSSEQSRPIGQIGLHSALALRRPVPAVHSYIVSGARRTIEHATHSEEYYPPSYDTDGTMVENLRFALRHEPLDLGVIHDALCAIGPRELADWVRSEPTGEFSRRAWFLYEHLTGNDLDLEKVATGNYVNALDEAKHFVAAPRNSRRHRVRDNLLGNRDLCPTARRTAKLEQFIAEGMAAEAKALAQSYDPDLLARATSFLYTKETRSSFAIEGEAPSHQREARFLEALRRVDHFNPSDKAALVRLQQSIVDPRYAATDWRSIQNFVSETTRGFGQHVHFICPRPQDVDSLMDGWVGLNNRLLASPVDPVVAAALSAFAFVFIHPFEDGNGRIHRFLIHHILANTGFSPPGLVFPISAAILRQRQLYDQVLDAFSSAAMPAIDWRWTTDSEIVVENDTRDLYRFFDATPQAEYLYPRVAEAIRVDLDEELGFLQAFDAVYQAVTAVVDMPNKRAGLLVRLLLQNRGQLSKSKRSTFAELTDDEIGTIEAATRSVIAHLGPVDAGPGEA